MEIKTFLTDSDAKMPLRAHIGDAGYDLSSVKKIILPPGKRKLINTGIVIEIPEGYYGNIRPRSGLSCKGIDIGAGIVDSGYRGEIMVLLINNSDINFTISSGDRIAQLIIEKSIECKFVKGEKMTVTSRGHNGFGSTG